MSTRLWPEDTCFKDLVLVPQQRHCDLCGAFMHVCDHRFHPISTLGGPVRIVAKLVLCPNTACPGHHSTVRPEEELFLTMPAWSIGWDVFAFIGHKRFVEAFNVREIRQELVSRFDIVLSDDAIEEHIHRYQVMLAARQQDPSVLARRYADRAPIVLTIDGLKPDQAHETLYVVRELTHKQVWFAQTLLSSAADELQPLFVRARQIADTLGVPVKAWMSDKQDAFVKGVELVFPGTPHYLCRNHFLRGIAEPVMQMDRAAVQSLRHKVRGLREIEREMLPLTRESESKEQSPDGTPTPAVEPAPSDAQPARAQTVIDYCAAIRGILDGTPAGPLAPASITMTYHLIEFRDSMQRCVDLKKGGLKNPGSAVSSDWSTMAVIW